MKSERWKELVIYTAAVGEVFMKTKKKYYNCPNSRHGNWQNRIIHKYCLQLTQ